MIPVPEVNIIGFVTVTPISASDGDPAKVIVSGRSCWNYPLLPTLLFIVASVSVPNITLLGVKNF